MTEGQGGPELEGCPGDEHFRWWLDAWRTGGPPVDPASILEHLLLTEDYPIDRVSDGFAATPMSGHSVKEVIGWRTSRYGDVVVTYRGSDDRIYDLVADVDSANGLLSAARQTRSANGADLGVTAVTELTSQERLGLHAVFDAAYRHADHAFLDRRLDGLDYVSMGWVDDRMFGFVAGGAFDADLPGIGTRFVADGGITCIDPSVQNMGLANAIGNEYLRKVRPPRPYELRVLHFATPITVKALFRFVRFAWPGNSVAEMAASLRTATPRQRAVATKLAELTGAISFDAENWVIRTGHPAGESTADPVDLEPEYAHLFAHVDRSRGDALLGVFWHVELPTEWWD